MTNQELPLETMSCGSMLILGPAGWYKRQWVDRSVCLPANSFASYGKQSTNFLIPGIAGRNSVSFDGLMTGLLLRQAIKLI